jgi:hypothetical protein
VAAAARAGGFDLEAVEGALRMAVLHAGAKVLEDLLEKVGSGRRKEPVRCACGAAMRSRGVRRVRVLTLLGEVRFGRSLFQCPACGRTCYPGDRELDIEGTSRSPGVRRQTARLGAKETFREAAGDMKELAGVALSRKDAERIAEAVGEDMERRDKAERDRLRFAEPPPPETPRTIETLYVEFDGTGVPMARHEVEGRKGKQKDGSAKTREAKIGCVFTQTAFDEEGRPIRDPASTTFTGAIEPAAEFGWRIYAEAVRRGLFLALRVVLLTDGAEWIRNLAELHFPGAIHILDLFHAREHLVELCRLLFERDPRHLNLYKDRWWEDLDDGNIERIVQEATLLLPKDPKDGKEARTAIGYFEKNKERMRYAEFRDRGLFVGSGVVEAACKHVIGQRLKQSGMEWSVRGANAIIALRCAEASNRTEDYWEDRAA